MFTHRIKIFTISGFDVHVDLSWFIVLILITWSLAVGFFPFHLPGQSPATYWTMGLIGALGLFASIILHELAHSVVARRFGVPMNGITLFIFGGVAEMSEEPPSPKAEFNLAIAGPLASVAIGAICYALAQAGFAWGWPGSVNGVLYYLGLINGILVLFNMVPAFPLDGGRVLRSILWRWRNNLKWATRVTSYIGSGFGLFLILLGVVTFISGNIIGGMWSFLIGMFLRNAAQMSYQQVLIRRALEGEPVHRFMQPNVATVPADASLRELVEDYIYRLHFKMLPVVDNGQLQGCITTRDVRAVPREQWDTHRVEEYMAPCSADNTISPEADATQALTKMSQQGISRLMVVDQGRLVGILSLRDLMKFIALKIELEEGADTTLGTHLDHALEDERHAETHDRQRGAA